MLLRLQGGAVMRVEPPQSTSAATSSTRHLWAPRAFALVHAEQTLLNASVNTGGGGAQGLHALTREGEGGLSSRSPSSGVMPRAVQQGGSGQIAHGVFGASEHVATQRFAFGQGLIKLGKQVLRDGCRETRRERASFVRVSYSAKIGWLGAPKAALK